MAGCKVSSEPQAADASQSTSTSRPTFSATKRCDGDLQVCSEEFVNQQLVLFISLIYLIYLRLT